MDDLGWGNGVAQMSLESEQPKLLLEEQQENQQQPWPENDPNGLGQTIDSKFNPARGKTKSQAEPNWVESKPNWIHLVKTRSKLDHIPLDLDLTWLRSKTTHFDLPKLISDQNCFDRPDSGPTSSQAWSGPAEPS